MYKELTNAHLLTSQTGICIKVPAAPNISLVLRKLLLEHRLRPHDLSKAVKVPHQTIHQMLDQNEVSPRISKLLDEAIIEMRNMR